MIKKPFLGYFDLTRKKISLKDRSSNRFRMDKGEIICDFQDFSTHKVFLSGVVTSPILTDPAQWIYSAYMKSKKTFARDLDGEFLIFIYNKTNGRLEIYNNPYETTNFYYYMKDGLIIFSDSVKKLIVYIPGIEIDKKSIPTFLSTGFSPSEKMAIKDIYRLLPTEIMIIDEKGVKIENCWGKEFRFRRTEFRSLPKKLDEYERLFQKNISNFLKAAKTKDLGMFLSGGSDTSFVYFQSAKVYRKPIHTFTATYEGFGFDESPKAKAVTAMRNGVHHKVLLSADDLDLIPEVVRSCEEPLAGSALAFYVLSREASKYVDTIFTGDPGDSLWGEYYPVAQWQKYIGRMPFGLRAFFHLMSKQCLKVVDWERLWEVEHVLALFDKKEMNKDFMQRLCTYRHYRDDSLKKLLNFSTEKNRCRIEIEFNKDNFHDALIESKMFYGAYFYNITMSQKHAETFGMNFFAPYLSREIIGFINSLPEDWVNGGTSIQKLANEGIKRRFHKEALLRYLPKRYVYGLQQSFDVPWHALFNRRLKILENLLKRLKRRKWYNNDFLEKLFSEYPKQKIKPHEINELKHHGYRIYCLLILEVWYMIFVEKADKENVPLEKYLEI